MEIELGHKGRYLRNKSRGLRGWKKGQKIRTIAEPESHIGGLDTHYRYLPHSPTRGWVGV